jgi:hypothetical protein
MCCLRKMLINSRTTTSLIATWITIARYLLCTPRSSSTWSSMNFSLCLLCIGNKNIANKWKKKGWLLNLKRALMMMMMMRKKCFYREFFSLLKLWKMKGTSMATTRWGHREWAWMGLGMNAFFGLFYFSTSVQRGTFENFWDHTIDEL